MIDFSFCNDLSKIDIYVVKDNIFASLEYSLSLNNQSHEDIDSWFETVSRNLVMKTILLSAMPRGQEFGVRLDVNALKEIKNCYFPKHKIHRHLLVPRTNLEIIIDSLN